MSQRAVEQALGRLLTDEEFRRRFFADPCRTSFLAGLELSPEELAALRCVPPRALAALSRRLDDKICRLCVPPTPGAEERPS